jgi:hypothetical protein
VKEGFKMKTIRNMDNKTLAAWTLSIAVVLLWAVWVSVKVLTPTNFNDRFAKVQLQGLVSEYVMKQARTATPPEQITAETQKFMQAVDQSVREASAGGRIILVNEALVGSSEVPDITAQVRQAVYQKVPEPKAAAVQPNVPAEMNKFFQGAQ